MNTQRRRGARSARPDSPPRICEIPGCGRPRSARGLCQTHDRQLKEGGAIQPIRPYRPRAQGTVKFAGLRLTPACVEQLDQAAKQRGLSHGAAIAEILEQWNARGAKRPPPAPNGSGAERHRSRGRSEE